MRSRAASTSEASSSAPSPEPSSGSTACSGCGIRPRTLPRLVAHAGDVADRAVAVLRVAQDDLARRLELAVQLVVGVPAALAVLDRDRQLLARLAAAR